MYRIRPSTFLSTFIFFIGIGTMASVFAITGPINYPVGAPVGEMVGGTYRNYFDNIFVGCSTPGDVITSFSATGVPSCITPTVTGLNLTGALGYTLYHNGITWVSSTNIYNANGNVGIGTSTPGAKLEINGQIKITGGAPALGKVLTSDAFGIAHWDYASGATFSGVFWSPGGNSILPGDFLGTLNSEDLILKTNGVERMRITSGGNIGGLSYASNLLGSNNFAFGYDAGRSAYGQYNTALGGYSPGYQLHGYYNTALGGSYAGYAMSGLSNVAIGTYAGSNMTTGNNNLYLGSYAAGVANRDNQFSLGNVIYGSDMGSSGLIDGKVGIGTMNPAYKLDVNGVGSFSSLHITAGAASGRILTSDPSGNAYWDDGIYSVITAAGNIVGGVENYVPKFGSGGNGLVSGLLYDNGTTLGVGTNTPATGYVLHASGSILIGNNQVFPDLLNENFEGTFPFAGWTTSAAGGMTVTKDSTTSSSGTSSLRFSGNGANNASSSASYTINIPANSFLSFYWKVSSEPGGDILAFCLDANPCTINTSGVTPWQNVTYNLSPGVHTLIWKYTKDPSLANGLDSAWIDQIRINRYGPTYLVGGHIGIDIPMPQFPLDVKGYVQSHGYCISGLCANTWRSLVEQGTSSGSYNLFVGPSSLGMNTTGTFNSAFGAFALAQNTAGGSNAALGTTSLVFNTTGNNNTSIGISAMYQNLAGSNNTALGYWALMNNSNGNNNIALGYKAGESITTGSNNIVLGFDIDAPTPTSSNTLNIGNLLFGTNINGTNTTLSSGNIGIGISAPGQKLSVSGSIQIIDGTQGAGKFLVSNALGVASWQSTSATLSGTYWSLSGNTVGTNDFIGSNNARDLVFKTNNVGLLRIYSGATVTNLRFAFTGGDILLGDMVIGKGSGSVGFNTALGVFALSSNTTGNANTAIGHNNLSSNTTGNYNTSLGGGIMTQSTIGNDNTAIGFTSMNSLLTGSANTSLGSRAMWSILGGGNNTALGVRSGYGILSGNNNIFLGYQAGESITTGSNNIVVGYDIDTPTPTSNNTLNIGNLLFGTAIDASGTALSMGNIGIGTPTPGSKLTISGSVQIIDGTQGSGKVLISDSSGIASWANIVLSVNASTIIGGTGNYIPKFGSGGIGLVSSLLYDNGITLAIGSTGATSRFEIWSGAISYLHMRGINNIGMGAGSVRSALTGNANTGFGHETLYTLTTGYSNSAFGHQALRQSTSGFNNSAFGKEAMYNDNDGTWNSAFGYLALRTATSSDYNVAMGAQSLYSLTTSQRNAGVGYRALYGVTTGSSNTALGADAGSGITTGSSNIMIGDSVQALVGTLSNQLNIGNWIYGSGGKISLGQTAVGSGAYTLDVQGGYINSSSGLCISDSCIPNWTSIFNAIYGSGNYLPKWNSSGTGLVASRILDNGTDIAISTGSLQYVGITPANSSQYSQVLISSGGVLKQGLTTREKLRIFAISNYGGVQSLCMYSSSNAACGTMGGGASYTNIPNYNQVDAVSYTGGIGDYVPATSISKAPYFVSNYTGTYIVSTTYTFEAGGLTSLSGGCNFYPYYSLYSSTGAVPALKKYTTGTDAIFTMDFTTALNNVDSSTNLNVPDRRIKRVGMQFIQNVFMTPGQALVMSIGFQDPGDTCVGVVDRGVDLVTNSQKKQTLSIVEL